MLLINLGTPDGTDDRSMRRYLKEFLSDRRVIELPRLVWWPILHAVVLTRRPRRSGKAYAAIWDQERDESPLRTFTRSQAEKLARSLGDFGPALTVDWAMRYGNPCIASRLKALMACGCERVLLFPLYPQYSATSTATANDAAFRALMAMRWQPAIRIVPPYYDAPVYIEALAESVRAHLAGLDWEPEVVLASYHGIPKSYFEKGDPYHCHCRKTTRLLRARLGWDEARLVTTFQSRFGRGEWLQPYTAETVKRLAAEGVRRLAVITPAFAADCLETLEEIAVAVAGLFREAGGERFTLIPCLNDSAAGMRVIEAITRRELSGWV